MPITDPSSHKSYRPLTVLSFRLNTMITGVVCDLPLACKVLRVLSCPASSCLCCCACVACVVLLYSAHPILQLTHFRIQDPHGFHAANVLLYGLCCAVACVTVFSAGDPAGRVTPGTAAAALLFTAHPIHTEAVASVVGRAEVLSAIFGFLAVAAYRHSAASSATAAATGKASVGRPGLWLTVFVGLCCAGLLCKELVVAIPVISASADVCALVAPYVGGDETAPTEFSAGQARRRVAVAAAISLGYLAVRLLAFEGGEVRGRFEDNPLRFIPRDQAALTALYLQTHNARLLVWPLEQSADYSFSAIPHVNDLSDPRLLFPTLPFYAGLLLAGLAGLYRGCKRADPAWVVAISWVVFPVLPTAHIVTVGLVLAERTLFLPSVGVSLALKLVVNQLSKRGRFWLLLAAAATVGLTAGFGVLTVRRNPIWRNETTLWQSVHEVYPDNIKGIYGVASTQNGKAAIPLFRKMLAIYPFHCYAL